MGRQLHGSISLFLVGLAVAVGMVASFRGPLWVTGVYFIIVVISSVAVLYFYCGKCTSPGRACGHILPGKLVVLLPRRKQVPYSFGDFVGTGLALALLVGVPQLWLWKSTFFFVLFWMVLIAALVEILAFVCRGCQNNNCPVCTRRNIITP